MRGCWYTSSILARGSFLMVWVGVNAACGLVGMPRGGVLLVAAVATVCATVTLAFV